MTTTVTMPSDQSFDHDQLNRPSKTDTRVQQSMGHPPPRHTEQLHCPRCDSLNTKFCYYNNYNLAQPRHFCKSCRRYWTQGGTLRDIPVGGGSRKNNSSKRASRARSSGSSSSCSPSSSSLTQEVTSVVPPKPISASAEATAEMAPDHAQLMDLNENVEVANGGFTSLLMNSQVPPPPPPPLGFLALGGYGYGYGPGLGHGYDDMSRTLGYGDSRGVWALPEVGDYATTAVVSDSNNGDACAATTGCNTWQMMTTGTDGGLVDGSNCFAWPELEKSMLPAAAGGKAFNNK